MTAAAVMAVAKRLVSARASHERAIEPLALCLEPLARSQWPDLAWRFSQLTADGCPVEIGFSDLSDALRVTLECAGPELPDAERIDAAANLLDRLGLPAPPEARMREWRRLQAGARLRWGCWLGLRWNGSALSGKLYVEIPPGCELSPPARVAGARVRMIGYDVAQDTLESYAALPELDPHRLREALRPLDDDAWGALEATLSALIGVPLAIALRWIGLGMSAASRDDEPSRLALFLRSRALRGGAAALRPYFLRRPSYEALLGARMPNELPDHGVVTLAPVANGGVELRVGVSALALAS